MTLSTKYIAGTALLAAAILAGSAVAQDYQFDADFWGLHFKGGLQSARDEGDEVRLKFGWPRRIPGEVPLWGRSPALVDFDRNGDLEIAIVAGDGRLAVLQHDGAYYPGFPIALHRGDRPDHWVDPSHPAPAAISDVDGDEWPEFQYVTDIGFLHAVKVDHSEPRPFPCDVGRNIRLTSVASVAINNDRSTQSFFAQISGYPLPGDSLGLLRILNGSGEDVRGWPVRYGYGSSSSPSLGDIDGDGDLEVVIGSARRGDIAGQIWAFNLDGSRVQGFPAGTFETIGGAPTLADVSGDGRLDILFYAQLRDGNSRGIYAYNGAGELLNGYPLRTSGGHPYGSPVIGGVVGNDELQIAFGSFDPDSGASIELFNRNGSRVEGFPIQVGSPAIVGSVMLADVDGDGRCEIVAACAPPEGGAGFIGAWNSAGRMASGFPISLGNFGGGAFASSPTLADLGSGHTEIICAATDGRVFVWETSGRFIGDVWPTEKGGFGRLGSKPPRVGLAAPREQNPVMPVYYSTSIAPNPFNGVAIASFGVVPGALFNAALFSVDGRRLVEVYSGRPNSPEVRLAIDARQLGLSPGVYLLGWDAAGGSGARKVVYLP